MLTKHFRVVANKSGWPTNQITPLLRVAYKAVKPELYRFQTRPKTVCITRTRKRAYCGRWETDGSIRLSFADPGKGYRPVSVSHTLCLDENEVVIALAAWMFTGSMGRPGCTTTVVSNAVSDYRKHQDKIKAQIADAAQRTKDKESEAFARQIFQGMEKNSLDYKLAQVARLEKAWLRKQKMAATKLKSLRRRRAALLAADARKRRQTEAQVTLPPIQEKQHHEGICPNANHYAV